MKLLKDYINNFKARAGNYILSTSILCRLLSFIASWIALQFISNKELGIVLFAFNIVVFILPISGLGLHQSLLRFGSLLKTREEKNNLFTTTFFKGIWASTAIIIVLICSSFFINFSFKNTQYYLIFLSFVLLPMYLFELIKIHFRLHYMNKLFAFSDLVYNIIFLISITVLSYFFQEKGYAAALILTPTISVIYLLKKHKLPLSFNPKPVKIELSFWKYGIFASLSNVVTQLLFVIDLLLIGFLLNDSEMVTNYKYISIIPLSLLFLPRAFINTDFVAFTENIYNKNYILKYIKSYMLLFIIISSSICVFFEFTSTSILSIFDSNFTQYNLSFMILIFGVCGILIFRGLFGNLLSSIGKAHVNFYITSFALVLNIISNYYLIPAYGILGAAITSATLMWFTGLLTTFAFWKLYTNRFLSKE